MKKDNEEKNKNAREKAKKNTEKHKNKNWWKICSKFKIENCAFIFDSIR